MERIELFFCLMYIVYDLSNIFKNFTYLQTIPALAILILCCSCNSQVLAISIQLNRYRKIRTEHIQSLAKQVMYMYVLWLKVFQKYMYLYVMHQINLVMSYFLLSLLLTIYFYLPWLPVEPDAGCPSYQTRQYSSSPGQPRPAPRPPGHSLQTPRPWTR